jgi:hypothetical protein
MREFDQGWRTGRYSKRDKREALEEDAKID